MNKLKMCIWGKLWPDGMTFMCIDYAFRDKGDQTYLVCEGDNLDGNRELRYFKMEEVAGYSIEYLT